MANKRKKTKGVSAKSIEQKKIDQYLIDFYTKELQISKSLYKWTKEHLVDLQHQELKDEKKMRNDYRN